MGLYKIKKIIIILFIFMFIFSYNSVFAVLVSDGSFTNDIVNNNDFVYVGGMDSSPSNFSDFFTVPLRFDPSSVQTAAYTQFNVSYSSGTGNTFVVQLNPNYLYDIYFYGSGSPESLYYFTNDLNDIPRASGQTATVYGTRMTLAKHRVFVGIDGFIVFYCSNTSVRLYRTVKPISAIYNTSSTGSNSAIDYSNTLNDINGGVGVILEDTFNINNKMSNLLQDTYAIRNTLTNIETAINSLGGVDSVGIINAQEQTTQAIQEHAAATEEQTQQQQQNYDSFTNTTSSDTDYNINIQDTTQDIAEGGIDSIFTTIKNTFTSSGGVDVVVPVPFTDKSFTIPSNMVEEACPNWVKIIIKAFWWYIISVFIVSDISNKINKIKSGNIENLENSNIKESML